EPGAEADRAIGGGVGLERVVRPGQRVRQVVAGQLHAHVIRARLEQILVGQRDNQLLLVAGGEGDAVHALAGDAEDQFAGPGGLGGGGGRGRQGLGAGGGGTGWGRGRRSRRAAGRASGPPARRAA